MNTADFDTSSTHDDDRFDAQARQAHAAAQGALSPRVRAQLQQRRRAALAAPRRATGMRWAPTLTLAATLALTVGVGLRLWSPPVSGPEPDAMAQGDPAASGGVRRATSTGADTAPALGAQGDAAPTQVAAAGGDAGADTHGAPSGTDGAEGPTTAAAASGSVEDEVDAIAALLAAPDAGTADGAGAAVGAGDSARDTATDAIGEDDALLAALEESPDFYLWLGADDSAGVEAL